jgi:hypothetical protein
MPRPYLIALRRIVNIWALVSRYGNGDYISAGNGDNLVAAGTNYLAVGSGLDWFFLTYVGDQTNMKPTDLQ